MKQQRPNPNEPFIHPYLFLLKEGNGIKRDFLDYSLLLLQVGQPEILSSPLKKGLTINQIFNKLNIHKK